MTSLPCNNCKSYVIACGHCGYALGVNDLILNKNEIRAIVDFMSDQYISYENQALIKLVKEMRVWLDQQE